MNEQDSYSMSQQILQLLLSHSPDPTLLNRLAQKVGELLKADVCWLESDRALDSRFVGYWCSASVNLSWNVPFASLATVRNTLSQSKQVSQVFEQEIPQGGQLVWGYKPRRKSIKTVSDEILNSIAIALRFVDSQRCITVCEKYQNLFLEVSQATHQYDDLNELLQFAVTEMGQTLEVQRSFAVLLKYQDPFYKTRNTKTVPQATGTIVSQWVSDSHIPRIPIHQDFQLTDCVCCQQAWITAPDPLAIADQGNFPDTISALFSPDTLPALLLIPLLSQKNTATPTVLGFLIFQCDRARPWETKEIDFMMNVGSQVSHAITYHRTLHQVQSLVADRTAQLQRSLEVQAKLYEMTRQQVDQLRQLVQLKDEFLDSISHELRTPLTSMKMAIRMLRRTDLTEDRREKYLDLLDQEWNREYNLIQDLLTLQKLESKQVQIQVSEIILPTFLQPLANQFNQKWSSKGLILQINYHTPPLSSQNPSSFICYSDPPSFERILLEILTNAGKYAKPQTKIIIDVTIKKQYPINQIVLNFTNFGVGIREEEQATIFDKFTRGQGLTEQAVAGTGLGLALVKSLVQHLNGTITVQSQQLETSTLNNQDLPLQNIEEEVWETCFTLTLPQRPPDK